MGLDMYLYAKNGLNQEEEAEEIGYWRKHPDLHRYIEKLYIDKGGDKEFNCVDFNLTKENIEDIIQKTKDNQLPVSTGGFFFGESEDEHKKETLEIMEVALKYLDEGYTIIYSSWW